MKKLLLMFVMSVFVFASIAQVTAVRGEANIEREGKKIPIKFGTQIEQSDNIITSATAKLQVRFEDGTIITVGKDSNISMKDYKFDPAKKENNKASFGIEKGLFKVVTGGIGKMNPEKFKLKTQTATMGIRGTELSINDKGPEGTVVGCSQGAISVTSNDTGASVPVPAGQMTDVAPGKDPSPARAYNPEELGGADEDVKEEKKEEKAAKKEEKKEEKKEAKEEKKEEKKEEAKEESKEEKKEEKVAKEEKTEESKEEKATEQEDTATEEETNNDEQATNESDKGDEQTTEEQATNDEVAAEETTTEEVVAEETKTDEVATEEVATEEVATQDTAVETTEVETAEVETTEIAPTEIETTEIQTTEVDLGDTGNIEIEEINVESFELEIDTDAIADSVNEVQDTIADVQETAEEVIETVDAIETEEEVVTVVTEEYKPPIYDTFDTSNLELIVDSADKLSYMEFGYWASDATDSVATATGPYLAGFETPSVTIEDYITQGSSATYSGNVKALVNFETQVSGTIDLNINFGAKNMTGNINITDWESTINSGVVSSGGYSSSDITGATSGVTSGNLDGYFFGDSAQETGGSFELVKDTGDSAVGVYGATK